MHLLHSKRQLVQVLAYQRAQHGIEALAFEGQLTLEVRERKRHLGVVAPCDL